MDWLYRKLNVADHEVARVNYMWSLQFLWQVGFVFAWTVVTALFLDIFGIQNILYLFLIDAWLLIAGSYLAHFCFLRMPIHQFLYVNVLATLGFLALAWFGRDNPVMFFTGVILAKDLFFSQVRIATLRRNEELMSPTEATHLMPVVETALTIGTIVGAGAFLYLLSFLPSKQVLFFWVVPLLALIVLIHFGPRYLRDIPQIHKLSKPEAEENDQIQFGALKKIRFLWLMSLVILIQGVLWSVLEFEFLSSLTEHVQSHPPQFELPAQEIQANLLHNAIPEVTEAAHKVAEKSSAYMEYSMAHALGFLELLFGLVALLVQGLLASRVLKHFGVVHTMLIYFLGLLGVVATFALGGISMNLVKGYKHGFHALFMSSYHLSFYSIFSKNRESVRHFLEGFIYPAGIIAGVGLMIICAQFMIPLSYLMVVLVSALALLMMPMREAFTYLSKRNLKSDQCILTKMHSIEVLGQRGHHQAMKHLGAELLRTDLHPVVREKIVVTLSRINDPEVIHIYVQILRSKTESDELKVKILESSLKLEALSDYWAKHAFSQYHLLETLKEFFAKTDNPHLRKLIVMNIFAHLPTSQVVPFFLEVLENSNEELKSVCLRSAGEIFSDPEVVYYVRKWLDHPNPKVRGYALIALWKFEDHEVLGQKIDAMLASDDEKELIAGIYTIGEVQDETRELHLMQLEDHPSEEVHMHVLVALAKLGDDRCVESLLDILFAEDEDRARRVFGMLKRAPKIRSKLKRAIQLEVSQRVMQILIEEQIKTASHLKRLPAKTRRYLSRLYRLAERYDELLHLE